VYRGSYGRSAPVVTRAANVAAVTGGGAGIGRAISRRLAADGARVAVLDVDVQAARETVEELRAGLALQADVSDSAAVDAAFERIEQELGPLSVLVNNAGATGAAHIARVAPLAERQREEAAAGVVVTPLDALVRVTDDEWHRLFAIHVDGTFYCSRAAVRAMVPRRSGVIINMASVCGIEGCTGHPHYSAAKAAILGLTKAAAKELIVQGIRVNALAPGFVETTPAHLREAGDEAMTANRRRMAATVPAGRLATPEEIASAAAFLASDQAAYFVGATLSPNGGLVTAV
jgi:3-oxoacyl-[acyl-carrier protein] reductase